uniref:Transglutaminase N-terminal domain-containing protein n=1 Tax=Gadus morhua TaxID=8049 RepID=A0A8C5BAS2_GADMO
NRDASGCLIAGVDLRSQENNRAHRTEEIDRKRLIVRRGQAFSLTVHLSDPLQSGHELALVLKQGLHNFNNLRTAHVHKQTEHPYTSI